MLKIVVMALALATLARVAAAGLPPASGEVVKHRAGGDPGLAHKSPGRNKYESITLERGLTHDSNFANWAAGAGGKHHGGRRGHGPHHRPRQ